jgi:teichuronic acid biosynthesis protein TuaE
VIGAASIPGRWPTARLALGPAGGERWPTARSQLAPLAPLALAVAASGIVGLTVTLSPVAAVALLVVCAGAILAVTKPTLLFAIGIALLAVEPARIFGEHATAGQPAAYKAVLYACTLPLLLNRGVDVRKCLPIAAYAVVTILAVWFGSPLPGLTAAQTASSLATLWLGWLVFAIDWDWRRDHRLLEALAWVPIVSVLLGLGLQAGGVLSLLKGASPPRLEGATIAAWLGTFSFGALIACTVLHRRERWRWARWVGLADVAILGATLTRGAVIALCIAGSPWLARYVKRQWRAGGTTGALRLVVLLALTLVAAAVLAPGLRARNESSTVYVAGRGGGHDATSGRLEAWAFAYDQAKVNLAFGRGLGAGPIVGKSPGGPSGFTAQHNEYVRMLLEVGVLGGLLLLLAMAASMASAVRRAPRLVRGGPTDAALAFAVYSITENTLSSTPIAMALLLVIGLAASRSSREPLAI